MGKRHSRGRRKALVGVGIAVVAILVLGVGVAWAYISNINSRLSSGITQETRDTLTDVADGDPFYMLLLGIDKDEGRMSDSSYGESDSNYRSDSIMVARIDPGNDKVTLVSIHRDTLVDMGEHGEQKINAAFTFGGAPYAIEFIGDFAGVDITHYAEIDMDGMAAVVDSVGGIDVDLPIPVVDPNYTELDLPAGEQHIDGYTAALLCRARHAYDNYGDGDLYRAANQRMVIKAVLQKVLKSDPATMAATVTAMAEMVNTDMDVASILSLASQMSGLDINKDIMTGMEPTESLYTNNTWYELCKTEEWKAMMERVDQGLDPYDGTTYDETQGVAAEMANGRDTGDPVTTTTTTTTEETTSSDSGETTSSETYSETTTEDGTTYESYEYSEY